MPHRRIIEMTFKGGKHIKKIMSENAQISNKEDEDIIYENSLIEITNIDIKKKLLYFQIITIFLMVRLRKRL